MQRGFKDTLVLIPGWAADFRIFSALELDYDYILPLMASPLEFSDTLADFLNERAIKKVSLFGWSLGGFLALDFALKNYGRIDEVVLLGIRKRFDRKALDAIKQKISKNKKAFLYRFYLECFSESDKQGLEWFRKNLLRDYLNEIELETLSAGLDYFSGASIEPAYFKSLEQVRIFHGSEDKIAPFEEALELAKGSKQVKFISLSGAGHIPFLNTSFKERFQNG